MAYAAKLCNPTPFPIKLDWDRGVKIKIEPYGETTLEMQQMDDFKPGKPGSEEVMKTLHYHGLFLFDVDRPYDNQALEALEHCRNAKKAQYDAAVLNLKGRRSAQGIQENEEILEEVLSQMGLTRIRDEVEVLTTQIKKFKKVVGEDHIVHSQMDPKRTVYVLEPPREFPSVAAMEFFLDQNEFVKAKHVAFQRKQEAPERVE